MNAGTTQAFSDEAVKEEDIKTILAAGLAAESAINQQPWFFAAVTDKDLLTELSSQGKAPGAGAPAPSGGGDMPAFPQGENAPAPDGDKPVPPPQGGAPKGVSGGPKASLGSSPLAIFIYKDESTPSPDPDFDCGLAAQNMYIAASSLGYGVKIVSSPTMTLNGEDHDAICEKLGVPVSFKAVAVLLVGTPDVTADGVSGRSAFSDKAVIID